ncbi:YozQ family protein [Bacillus sp. FSL W7-1034]|nr:YozQ family protein [Bacillus altitudinis]WHY07363.1 YozQ family protein [Bacillus altitudinis]
MMMKKQQQEEQKHQNAWHDNEDADMAITLEQISDVYAEGTIDTPKDE